MQYATFYSIYDDNFYECMPGTERTNNSLASIKIEQNVCYVSSCLSNDLNRNEWAEWIKLMYISCLTVFSSSIYRLNDYAYVETQQTALPVSEEKPRNSDDNDYI